MPPDDYPAAHSMDTEWFAVDKDGHVGAFYSGEDGVVPREVYGDEGGEMMHRIARAVPLVMPVLGPDSGECHRAADGAESLETTILFLESDGPIRELVEDGRAEL